MAKTTKAKTKVTTSTRKTSKKPAVEKKVTAKKKAAPATSPQFMQASLTSQSLYWVIFGVAAILFALWLYTLDARIRDLYDQIDQNTMSTDALFYDRKVITETE